MDPLVIGIVGFGVLTLALRSFTESQMRKRRALDELRSLWGKPRVGAPSAADSSLYHDLCLQYDESWAVDDRTWQDLFVPELFKKLNHTRSRVGSQMLYRVLRCPAFSLEEIRRRDRVIRMFSTDTRTREAVQAALEPLNNADAGLLPNLFLSEIPPRPNLYWIYPLLTCTMILAIAALAIFRGLPLFLLMVTLMIVNSAVSKVYRDKVEPWIQPIRVLNTLVRAARNTATIAKAEPSASLMPYVQPIIDSQDALSRLDRNTKWLLFERNNSSDPLMIVVEYINMILLLDVNSFVFSMDAIRGNKSTIKALFEAVGIVDVLAGVASYRDSLARWSTPDHTENARALEMVNGIHPLIPEGVANTIKIDGNGILITGSNMSGKTTFIRTVGVNALLGQTIATCLAERFTAPIMGIETSIGRSDSLSEGKSFYLDEVEAIGEFLDDAAGAAPCLFIIDEIFRGTNTTERVAASKAVLDSLNRVDGTHIVLVSTHDVELPNLLETPWDRYHFREYVENGDLLFDYKLRTGLSSTRNALLLLASRGYPADVVADAEATAKKIEQGLHDRHRILNNTLE